MERLTSEPTHVRALDVAIVAEIIEQMMVFAKGNASVGSLVRSIIIFNIFTL